MTTKPCPRCKGELIRVTDVSTLTMYWRCTNMVCSYRREIGAIDYEPLTPDTGKNEVIIEIPESLRVISEWR